MLGPSNTAKGIPQIGPYLGRVSAPVAVVAPLAVEQALQMDPSIKTVGVAYAAARPARRPGPLGPPVSRRPVRLLPGGRFQTLRRWLRPERSA